MTQIIKVRQVSAKTSTNLRKLPKFKEFQNILKIILLRIDKNHVNENHLHQTYMLQKIRVGKMYKNHRTNDPIKINEEKEWSVPF